MTGHRADDLQIEARLGLVLRGGVVVSTACLAVGLLAGLAIGETPFVHGLLNVGLVLLLATPVARVAMSVVEYARGRDWLFVALTAAVLLELLAGVVAALVFRQRI